jgi:hypothetical protein
MTTPSFQPVDPEPGAATEPVPPAAPAPAGAPAPIPGQAVLDPTPPPFTPAAPEDTGASAPARPAASASGPSRILTVAVMAALVIAVAGAAFAIGRSSSSSDTSNASATQDRAGGQWNGGNGPRKDGNGNGGSMNGGTLPGPDVNGRGRGNGNGAGRGNGNGRGGDNGQGMPGGDNGQGMPGGDNGQGMPGGDNGMGFPGNNSGNRAFPGGGFRGGLGSASGGPQIEGTVESVTADSVTIKTAGGMTVTVGLDSTTTYHQQAPATAADVKAGASVQLQLSGGFRPGAVADGSGTVSLGTASDVTVVP